MLPCHGILPFGLDGTSPGAVVLPCNERMDTGSVQIPSVPVCDDHETMALQLQRWQLPRQRSFLSLQLETRQKYLAERLMCGRDEDLLSRGLCV